MLACLARDSPWKQKSGEVRETPGAGSDVVRSRRELPASETSACSPGNDVQRRGSGDLGLLTVGRGCVGEL